MAHHNFNDYNMDMTGEYDGITLPYQNATTDDYNDFPEDYPASDDLACRYMRYLGHIIALM